MSGRFLLYGSTGFVGREVLRRALERGLEPVAAGRDRERVESQGRDHGVDCRVFSLHDGARVAAELRGFPFVVNCAGPFMHTYRSMATACLEAGVHYLDITGELPVFEGLASMDGAARARGVMLLPAVGFDVVPTDCLALHLKRRLPSATRLTLALQKRGPAGLPPGTANTSMELIRFGNRVREGGRLVRPPRGIVTRAVDFGDGPIEVIRFTWGDVFTAYHTTGIPNVETYIAAGRSLRRQMVLVEYLRPLFRLAAVRKFVRRRMRVGSTAEQRAQSRMNIWGEVTDERGTRAVSRLHGPEAGVDWTVVTTVAAAERVLGGVVQPGFRTPAAVFGPEFVFEGVRPGVVTREDVT